MTALIESTGRLEAHGVGMVFGGGFRGRGRKVALDDASLAIGGDVARITAVVGESGSGKTTLTRLLLGFQRPTSGRVTYDGSDLATMSAGERVRFRREVQAVFQDPFEVFNPFYRVDHPLVTPLLRFGLAHGRDEARAKVEAALTTVGLRPQDTLGRYPHQLSGGQRQRVMIARALLLQPKIILADEPVSMVDASLRSTILETLLNLKNEAGISLIYVTHDLTTAYQVADDIVVLYAGSIVEAGPVAAVIREPKHPYTRMLVEAIPSPDPDVPWDLSDDAGGERAGAIPTKGCLFAPRCPRRFEPCDGIVPQLRPFEAGRRVRCHLFDSGAGGARTT